MNFYNIINAAYLSALTDPTARYHTKVMPLDHWENAVGELYEDIITDTSAQQTIGTGNGVRRSLTISLADEDGKYSPSRNSHFWYGRKFSLWEGVEVGSDVYWQQQGVYYSTKAEEYKGAVNVTAVDKFGALNGETNTGRCPLAFTTDIASGDIYIADLIRELLGRNTGSLPIDPIAPIIDPIFETTKLYADITLNAGQFYGEILLRLADMYGADCYYDRFGRLNFRKKAVKDRPYWYEHMGHAWTFSENDPNITEGVRRTTDLKAVNTVTVMSDNKEGEAASVTLRNTNPESPVCVQNVGEQYPDECPLYISIGDTTIQTAEEKCRAYAEYVLCQNTAQLCTESFTTVFLPHLDTDKLIDMRGDDRLITGITVDHKTKLAQISACSVSFLPKGGIAIE